MKRLIIEKALVPDFVSEVKRADDNFNPGEITPAIITAILDSDLVVADLTGANPNVFYELAVAHAYDKPTIHIRQAGEVIPFDLKDVRVFEYGLDLEGGDRARSAIAAAATELLMNKTVARTPVSGGRTLLRAQQSTDSGDQIAAEMLIRLGNLEVAIDRLLREGRIDSSGRVASAERSLAVARESAARLESQIASLTSGLRNAKEHGDDEAVKLLEMQLQERRAAFAAAQHEWARAGEQLKSVYKSPKGYVERLLAFEDGQSPGDFLSLRNVSDTPSQG